MLDRKASVAMEVKAHPWPAWQPPCRDVRASAKYRRVPPRSSSGRSRVGSRPDGRRGHRGRQESWDDDEDADDLESSGASGSSVRGSTASAPPDEAALLRELNTSPESTAALLQAFDGDYMGTDDINEFARVRSESHPLPPERSSSRSSAGSARGSTASSMSAPAASDAGSSSSADPMGQVFASTLPAGVQLVEEGTGLDMTCHICVQPMFALRNEEVMSALASLNLDIRVEMSESESEDEPDEITSLDDPHSSSYLDADLADIDISGNLNRNATTTTLNRHQPSPATTSATSSASEAGNLQMGSGPEAGAAWMSEVQGLGMDWSMQRSPTGEVYLESQKRSPTAKKTSAPRSSPAAKKPLTSARAVPAAARTLPGSSPRPVSQPASGPRDDTPPVLKPALPADPQLKPALRMLRSPDQVLDFVSLLFPKWATSGCRLAAPAVLAALPPSASHYDSPAGRVAAFRVAPTPWEAAHILQGLALASRKAGWGASRRLELCKDVRVLGLLEALRTQPPRLSPDQEASPALAKSLISLFSTVARTWWLGGPPSPSSPTKPTPQATPNHSSVPAHTSSQPASSTETGNTPSSQPPTSMHHQSNGPERNSSPERLVVPTWSQGSDSLPNTLDSPVIKLNGHVPHVPSSATPISATGLQQDKQALLNSMLQSSAAFTGQAAPNGAKKGMADEQYSQLLARYLNSSQEETTQKTVRHQTIVSGLWAMASLAGSVTWQTEMEGLLRVASAGGTTWALCGPGDLGSVTWALATAQHWTQQLAKIAAVCGQGGGDEWPMAPDEISRLLWAYATLNHPLTGLPLPADWAWRQGMNGGDVQTLTVSQLAVCCWALAVRRLTGTPAFTCAWQTLLDKAEQAEAAGQVTLTKVWQVALEVRLTGKEGQQTYQPVPASSPTDMVNSTVTAAVEGYAQQRSSEQVAVAERLLRRAHAVFLAGGKALSGPKGRSQGHSSYQRQMGNALVALHHMHVMEDVSSGYAVDLSLPRLKVAIEADGPSHFSRVPGPRGMPVWPLGATAMKRRHLKAMGWALVSISTQEWDAASSTGARQALLNQRITWAVQERMDADAVNLS